MTAPLGIHLADLRDIEPPVKAEFDGTDLTDYRRWPFFLGGNADGAEEHAFVVEDLIHEATMVMIFGPQGTLKTALIMDIAAHVRRGVPYQGLSTTPGCTIYIAAEGAGAIAKRTAAFNVEYPPLPPDWIVPITQAVSLMSEHEARDFAEFTCREIFPLLTAPVRMLVFDTMAKSMPGESDSADETISRLEANARIIAARLAEENLDRFVPACVLIHHPRKNDGEYRGSGSIEGNFDTIIKIERTDAEKLEDRLFEISLIKVKDGPTEGGWAYRAGLVHVGTTLSGKENYAPIVRYVGDEERIAAKAEVRTKGKKTTKSQKHLIELTMRIETRDGHRLVPSPYLEQSGYLAAAEKCGWDRDAEINGIQLKSLQDLYYGESDGVTVGEDGQRTVEEKVRKRWERARDSLVKSGHAWTYAGWIWIATDVMRTEADAV